MQAIINIATRAAQEASKIIVQASYRLDQVVAHEKSPNDWVSEIDILAEQAIIDVIHTAYPDHSILAEESGQQGHNDEYQWIIDPLDGTTNFLHGHPHFSISIAVKHRQQLEHAVIYDPLRNECFSATRGRGAQMNNRRIRVSQKRDLKGALIGTGFPFKHPELLDGYLARFKRLFPHCGGMRRSGSAALDLAYVAAGRLDGFWEFNLKPWDIAAGILLIKEAGGLVSDFNGEESYFESGNIVAATPKLCKTLLPLLQLDDTSI